MVTTDRQPLTLWQAGHLSYREALATERMRVEGRRDLVRSFSRWVPISHVADVEPAATRR